MFLPDNTPILDTTTLFLGIPDFLAEAGDGYSMFVEGETMELIVGFDSGLDQFTVVQQAVLELGDISPVADGRIFVSG